MMTSKYSPDTWAAIEADIENGMAYREAAKKHGIPYGTISSHMAEKKAKYRCKCPRCGTVMDSPKIKFCWNCGADVRSEETLLLEDVKRLMAILTTIPSSQADEGVRIANKIKAYIEKKGG